MKKETIDIVLNKTSLGYTVINEREFRIDYFNDDDEGRQNLIQYLVEELFNKEVSGGKKYK